MIFLQPSRMSLALHFCFSLLFLPQYQCQPFRVAPTRAFPRAKGTPVLRRNANVLFWRFAGYSYFLLENRIILWLPRRQENERVLPAPTWRGLRSYAKWLDYWMVSSSLFQFFKTNFFLCIFLFFTSSFFGFSYTRGTSRPSTRFHSAGSGEIQFVLF